MCPDFFVDTTITQSMARHAKECALLFLLDASLTNSSFAGLEASQMCVQADAQQFCFVIIIDVCVIARHGSYTSFKLRAFKYCIQIHVPAPISDSFILNNRNT